LTVVAKDLFAGETRRPDFLDKNVAGRVPVLQLDDGTCLAESDAIVLFLAEGSALLPDDKLERCHVLRWMFFEQSAILPTVGTARFLKLTGRDTQRPDVYAQRVEATQDALATLERHFGGHDWAALGRFTVADIALYAYGSVVEEAGIDVAPYPAFAAWRKRVEAQPGHVKPDWGFAA
ncbi:MAG TPA: glutathione S-transferase family protein, partial [Magnetospirillum sp.]|nr:glutathione S-transferase family protein [Magnetospirillum sp.]